MRKITKIEPVIPTLPTRKKVAAYARVSMETERLHHSLSTQISYYSDLIQRNPEWEYVGVYADDGITGTQANKREEFQRLLDDCEAGKIDIILTKSISRFARNTVDLLETVRHLKEPGISVRFEKENIDSLSGDGEVMLTLLASFAQEEITSLSNNVKWGIRKRFEKGVPNFRNKILGYEWEGDHLVVVPEEAVIVKRIFQNFLDGKSRLETERELNGEGITTKGGYKWCDSNIRVILSNITYTGNLLLQKEYISDPITKQRRKNKGELPQYFVENTHEAVIDMETFQFVQDEMARRRGLGALANKSLNTCCFTGKLKCPHCGVSLMHHIRKRENGTENYWKCGTTKKKDGRCPVRGGIRDDKLRMACADALGLEEFDEDAFLEQVDHIEVPERYQIEIHLKDGRIIPEDCTPTGHQDCWTSEYRAKVSAQRRKNGTNPKGATCFTGKIKCTECGCWYGSKVWHSNSKYKKTIWRCNHKYDGDQTCSTPRLTDEEIQAAFLRAANKLLATKNEVVANGYAMIDVLFDTAALEAEHDELLQETQVVSDMVQKCIYENAHVALDQTEYQKRYDGLTQRFDKAKSRLVEVTEEISQKQTQRANYEAFLKAFKKLPDQLTEFSAENWHALVDYATVYADGRLTSTFKNGSTFEG